MILVKSSNLKVPIIATLFAESFTLELQPSLTWCSGLTPRKLYRSFDNQFDKYNQEINANERKVKRNAFLPELFTAGIVVSLDYGCLQATMNLNLLVGKKLLPKRAKVPNQY